MYCPTCGSPNVSEAQFCANCGAVLAPVGSDSLPATPLSGDGLHQTEIQVSPCTAAVAIIPAGAIVGDSVGLIFDYARYGYYEAGTFIGAAFLVAGIAISAVALPPSLNTGRIVALGIPVMILGGMLGQTGMGLIGLGIGMLLPLTFWRQMLADHRVALVALGVTGVITGALGLVTVSATGESWARYGAIVFALFFVTPAVLIKPVIQRMR